MSLHVRTRLGACLLVFLGLAACSHEEKKAAAPAAPPKPPTAAEMSGKSLQLAAQEQNQLAEQAKRVDAAHAATLAAEQGLAKAQLQEQQERTKTEALQQQVNQHLAEGMQQSQLAQAGVAGHGPVASQSMQTAVGRVALAAPSRVVLQTQGGKTMTFTVDQKTRVLIGSQARAVTDIQQGADAAVAYDPRGGQMTALVVRVMPALANHGTAHAPSGTGQPQAAPSPPPSGNGASSGNGGSAPPQQ
jgi:hypothetical protein